MADLKRQAGLVSQLLQFELEQPHPRTVGPTAIRGDHQVVSIRIPFSAHHIQPAADRVDRELRSSLSTPTLTQPALAAMS